MRWAGARARHRRVSVAIIGAGLGGIATAVALRRSGIERITLFERSPQPGGTWYDNRYPGCEVDIQSHLYSFSFMPYDWTRTHASQPELRHYIEATIDRFGLRERLRLSTPVVSLRWDEAAGEQVLQLEDGSTERFTAAVSCIGLLNNPNFPDWPGLDSFEGRVFHTARWDPRVALAGKRVAVVGTGSTAAQVVPAIAPDVEQLFLFQRQPGWVVPKPGRAFTPSERELWRRSAVRRRMERCRAFVQTAKVQGAYRTGTAANALLTRMSLDYLQEAIEDDDLRAVLTPDYPFGCKRPVISSSFYPALNRDNVTVVPHAVERATADGLVAADGVERAVDVVITATGFTAADLLASLRVLGRGDRDLHEIWGDSPEAFLGTTVPGFPNFFIVYGPNTNGVGPATFQFERQAAVIAKAVRRLCEGASFVDTRPRVHRLYNDWVDERSKSLATGAACNNYFHSPSGRNVTQWPGTQIQYWLMIRTLFQLGTVAR